MFCCIYCFKDKHLKQYISNNGIRKNCSFCRSKNVKCIEPYKLKQIFQSILMIYDTPSLPLYWPVFSLGKVLQDDWEIFNSRLNIDDINEILDNVRSKNEFESELHESSFPGWINYENSHYYRVSFNLWDHFADYIKYQNRFIIGDDKEYIGGNTNDSIIDLLKESLELVEDYLKENTNIYRARIGSKEKSVSKYQKKIVPYEIEEMGPPPIEKSKPGRANPSGIVYLYLATDKNTALAEVRPWKGAFVSIAKFKIKEDLKVINLSDIPTIESPFKYFKNKKTNLKRELEKRNFLEKLSQELSKPVDNSNSEIEYAPTQYLTELIRTENYDGIIFNSAMGEGDNIVLFNSDKVKGENVELVKVDDINYLHSEVPEGKDFG